MVEAALRRDIGTLARAAAGLVSPGALLVPPAHTARDSSFTVTPWNCAPPALTAWDDLAVMAAEPNPFAESWYLGPSLAAYDPNGSVQLARLEQYGAVTGLLPLRCEARYYGHPLPHLRAWQHGNAFLGTPLVACGSERAFWERLLAWADAQSGAALFLHLADLPLDGPLFAALRGVVAAQDRPAAIVSRTARALLASDLAPDTYLAAALSSRKRKELRRQHKRLSELGALVFVRQSDDADLAAWSAEFLALEAAGWKGARGSAMAGAPATETIFRKALLGAAARGRLERLTLRLDGRAIAMLVNFITPPGAFSYKTAFAEDLARFSPGVLLQLENLGLLERTEIAWCDSCAAADHPMIDHVWRERRAIGSISIGIGGTARRALFRGLLKWESGGRAERLA